MTKDEALKLALEALEDPLAPTKRLKAITAIREALAQPEQEPVFECPHGMVDTCCSNPLDCYLNPSFQDRNP